jgi:hypothetical protein
MSPARLRCRDRVETDFCTDLYCEYKVAVSMSGDPDEYASPWKKLRSWAQRQVERERRREWLIRIIVAALFCVWLYWIIRILIRGAL